MLFCGKCGRKKYENNTKKRWRTGDGGLNQNRINRKKQLVKTPPVYAIKRTGEENKETENTKRITCSARPPYRPTYCITKNIKIYRILTARN